MLHGDLLTKMGLIQKTAHNSNDAAKDASSKKSIVINIGLHRMHPSPLEENSRSNKLFFDQGVDTHLYARRFCQNPFVFVNNMAFQSTMLPTHVRLANEFCKGNLKLTCCSIRKNRFTKANKKPVSNLWNRASLSPTSSLTIIKIMSIIVLPLRSQPPSS